MVLILAAALGLMVLFGLLVELWDRKASRFDEEIVHLRLKNDLADGFARAALWLAQNRPPPPVAHVGETTVLQARESADTLLLHLPDDLASRSSDRGSVTIQIHWLNYRPPTDVYSQNDVESYPPALELFLQSQEGRVFSQSYAAAPSPRGQTAPTVLRGYRVRVQAQLDQQSLKAEEVVVLQR